MIPIAGQTAGPIGLKFFVDTQGWPGGDIGFKKSNIFFSKIFFFKIFFFKFFFPPSTPGPSASYTYNKQRLTAKGINYYFKINF